MPAFPWPPVRQPVEAPTSVADGLLAYVGDLTFPIISSGVEGIATVTDADIIALRTALRDYEDRRRALGGGGLCGGRGGKVPVRASGSGSSSRAATWISSARLVAP